MKAAANIGKKSRRRRRCDRRLFAVEFTVEFYNKRRYARDGRREGAAMPNIKPISDLRNYGEVLRDVAVGSPVFLTKNGRGRYAIVDLEDYEKTKAALRLMKELSQGKVSGDERGWRTSADVRAHFQRKINEI